MKVLDLFCSGGGFSEGFKQAGYEIKYGVDIDKTVKETFEYNHPDAEFILGDIRTLDCEDFSKVDIIIGSPPCPEFSQAKADRDPSIGMVCVNAMYRWIQRISPRAWIMENVSGVKPFLRKEFKAEILDCVQYGVPQHRLRCFHGKFNVPVASHLTPDKWVTVRQSIGDLMNILELDKNNKVVISKKYSVTGNKNNDRFSLLDEPSGTLTTIPPSLFNLEATNSAQGVMAKRLKSKFGMHNRYAKFNLDEPACTITPMHGDAPIIPYGKMLRRLTVRECARLQSFPDTFKFIGSKNNGYKMVGNAVPPLMAKKLAENLFKKQNTNWCI